VRVLWRAEVLWARRDALASTLQFIRNNADNLEKCLFLGAGSIAEPVSQ
jgi:hypothetical protein